MTLGENLEYKRDFLLAKTSFFKLRIFAQRDTPYQKEAQQLVENHEQETTAVAKPPPKPIVETTSIELIPEPIQEVIPKPTITGNQQTAQPQNQDRIESEHPEYEMAEIPEAQKITNKKRKF